MSIRTMMSREIVLSVNFPVFYGKKNVIISGTLGAVSRITQWTIKFMFSHNLTESPRRMLSTAIWAGEQLGPFPTWESRLGKTGPPHMIGGIQDSTLNDHRLKDGGFVDRLKPTEDLLSLLRKQPFK